MSVVDLNAFRERRAGRAPTAKLLREGRPASMDYRLSSGPGLTAPSVSFICGRCGTTNNNLVWLNGLARCPACRGPR